MSPRIVYTIAGLHPESGGPSRSVPALASAVAMAGAAATLLSLDFGTQCAAPIVPTHGGVATRLIPCSGLLQRRMRYTPAFTRELAKVCREEAVGLVHDTGVWLPTNHGAGATARRLRLPLVISPRGMLTAWSLAHRGWKKQLAWWLYQQRDLHSADLLHATSTQEAEGFRAIGLRQPIAVIGNGVDLPPAADSTKTKGRSRERTLLFLSRIHPKKGVLDLLDAWRAVDVAGWRLRIVGGGDSRHVAEMQRRIATCGLDQSVELHGPVTDGAKWDEYQAADVFVLPSYSENFGIVVAEALGAALPVITTRKTPWRELEEQRCGWWIDGGVEPLKAAMTEAMQLSDEHRAEMGLRGRALIERKYTWELKGAEMVAAYEWVLNGGPQPTHVL